MTHRGELFGESPAACPFLALELDRDRRADKPDYRHRCYAEPTPQPRAIAHQEAYCLSADFPACPIFQGWAMRAAARPVPAPTGKEGRGASSTDAAAAAVAPEPAQPRVSPAPQPPLPADLAPVVPAPGEPWPSAAFTPPDEPEDAPRQMAAFDAPLADERLAGGVEPDGVGLPPIPPPMPVTPTAWSSANPPADEPDDAPMPGFLAGRSEREPLRPRAVRPDVQFREKVTREDVIPSWDLTSRYGATVKEDRGGDGGGDRFGGLVTAIAVIAILALGVAGVIFLPGLLSGRHPATPTPSLVIASPTLPPITGPTLPPDATATPQQTIGPSGVPSTSPEPAATPRLYRIKAGDQLYKIAKRFHVSVADILAANPQITDPDRIIVGQVIVIPFPSPTATPSPSPSPSPSP
jgi:LysM repeat protein